MRGVQNNAVRPLEYSIFPNSRAGEPEKFLAAPAPDFFQAAPAPDFFPRGSGSGSLYFFLSGSKGPQKKAPAPDY